MLSDDHFKGNFSNNEPIRVIYELIALSRSAIIFYFLYSVLGRPMPKLLRWLWALPVLNLSAEYILKMLANDLYNASFYENWYLDFPLYSKILFTGLMVWQVTIFRKEAVTGNMSKTHDQLIKFYWGKYFVYFQLILSSSTLMYLFFTLANGRLYHVRLPLFIYAEEYYNMIYLGFTALFLLVFGYLALRNPSVIVPGSETYKPHFEQKMVEVVLPSEEKSIEKNFSFSEEQKKHYTAILKKLMENDKAYLDPELSLSRLSQLSGVSSRQLSQFIKQTFHKNYKEYINGYRTRHAQQLLTRQDASRLTMYSIAFDSGFSSESAFYKVFKQHTNVTPKQYQDRFKTLS